MKKPSIPLILAVGTTAYLWICGVSVAAAPTNAPPAKAEKGLAPAKGAASAAEAKKNHPLAIKGKVLAVNDIAKTITLEAGDKPKIFQVTSETRFYADEKPMMMKDVPVGEIVKGRAQEIAGDKLELKALYLPVKPAPKQKDLKPETKPEKTKPAKSQKPSPPASKSITNPPLPPPDKNAGGAIIDPPPAGTPPKSN